MGQPRPTPSSSSRRNERTFQTATAKRTTAQSQNPARHDEYGGGEPHAPTKRRTKRRTNAPIAAPSETRPGPPPGRPDEHAPAPPPAKKSPARPAAGWIRGS